MYLVLSLCFEEHRLTYLGKFGVKCRFSHDQSSKDAHEGMRQQNMKKEETPEEGTVKLNYQFWRRLIRRPAYHDDLATMQRVWDGALDICQSRQSESMRPVMKLI